jgi:hypothetical protein
MSQEMHVLRPARFYTGDFKRTIQRLGFGLGDQAKVIGAPTMPMEQAEDVEAKLMRLVGKHSGTAWRYGQDVVGFSGQLGYEPWHHARAFAAYEDHPFRKFLMLGRHPFEKGMHPHGHPALVTSQETRRTSFPNLVFSKDNVGFFFPVALAFPVESHYGFIGSSPGLLDEAGRLERLMRTRGYWHDDIDRVVQFVKEACASSITLQLPIIIDG